VKTYNRVPMMISYVSWPKYLSALILPLEVKEKYVNIIRKLIDQIKDENDPFFYEEEFGQLERLIAYLSSKEPESVMEDRLNFSVYIREYDKRRSTKFTDYFPELYNFINNNYAIYDFTIKL